MVSIQHKYLKYKTKYLTQLGGEVPVSTDSYTKDESNLMLKTDVKEEAEFKKSIISYLDSKLEELIDELNVKKKLIDDLKKEIEEAPAKEVGKPDIDKLNKILLMYTRDYDNYVRLAHYIIYTQIKYDNPYVMDKIKD